MSDKRATSYYTVPILTLLSSLAWSVIPCHAQQTEKTVTPAAAAQAPVFNIESSTLIIGPRTPINPFGAGHHMEVMAAADPESADNLIVSGARVNPRTGAAYEGYVYQSNDRGLTWREALVDANSRWVTEESSTFGEGHQAYFLASASNTSTGSPDHEYGNMRLYRSPDGGRTWQTIQTDHFMDWTSMAVDLCPGPNRGTLYIFANEVFDGMGGDLPGNKPYLAIRREVPKLDFSVIAGNWTSDAMRGKSGHLMGGLFPQGTVVLSDGTVITVSWAKKQVKDASGKETSIEAVNSYASRDGGKTLEGPVTIWKEYILSNLAVNKATDRLFVAFSANAHPELVISRDLKVEGELMIATSPDKGRTWRVHPVRALTGTPLDVGFFGTPSIAVNKDGVIGLLWYGHEQNTRAYFGVSHDDGATITQITSLTPEQMPSAAGQESYIDLSMAYGGGSPPLFPPYGNALVADSAGTFHPVWCERMNGPIELFTQTISLAGEKPTRGFASRQGLTDVTDRVLVREDNFRFDHLGRLYAYDVVVTNRSSQPLSGPILAVLPEVKHPLNSDNADNRQADGASTWQLFTLSGGLGDGQTTDPRAFTFRVNKEVQGLNLKDVGPPGIKVYAKVP